MSFDLGDALRRKGEHETARLDDFAFRLRARTMKLLAERLGRDPAPLIAAIALAEDEAILASESLPVAAYTQALADAQAQLIAERGDPSPHRLA
jgi:hypothetical protein